MPRGCPVSMSSDCPPRRVGWTVREAPGCSGSGLCWYPLIRPSCACHRCLHSQAGCCSGRSAEADQLPPRIRQYPSSVDRCHRPPLLYLQPRFVLFTQVERPCCSCTLPTAPPPSECWSSGRVCRDLNRALVWCSRHSLS